MNHVHQHVIVTTGLCCYRPGSSFLLFFLCLNLRCVSWKQHRDKVCFLSSLKPSTQHESPCVPPEMSGFPSSLVRLLALPQHVPSFLTSLHTFGSETPALLVRTDVSLETTCILHLPGCTFTPHAQLPFGHRPDHASTLFSCSPVASTSQHSGRRCSLPSCTRSLFTQHPAFVGSLELGPE